MTFSFHSLLFFFFFGSWRKKQAEMADSEPRAESVPQEEASKSEPAVPPLQQQPQPATPPRDSPRRSNCQTPRAAMTPRTKQQEDDRKLYVEMREERARLAGIKQNTLTKLTVLSKVGNDGFPVNTDHEIKGVREEINRLFSPVPREFAKRPPKVENNVKGVESRIKDKTLNPDYDSVYKQRHEEYQAMMTNPGRVVDLNTKLRARWVPNARTLAAHKKKYPAESSLSGLFTKNAEITQGVEQGPIPDVYHVDPNNNPRKKVEKKLEARASLRLKVTRKAPPAHPLDVQPKEPKKVPKDYVPRVATIASKNEGDISPRRAVTDRIAKRHEKDMCPPMRL